jgi:ABC-type Fe3+-siderophore transport system permease subunit
VRPVGKVRSVVVIILLSIVTLGIYGLAWQYLTFREMKDYSGTGVGGGLGLVFAIFLLFVNWFLMPSEVSNLYSLDGQDPPVSGLTGFWVLLPLVGGIVWLVKTQHALNRFWVAHGAPA